MQEAPKDAASGGRIERRLLEILVCPRTKTSLIYDESRQELISRATQLAYPIEDGVAVLVEERARTLDEDEVRALNRR